MEASRVITSENHSLHFSYNGVLLSTLNASATHGSYDTRFYPSWMVNLVRLELHVINNRGSIIDRIDNNA